MSLNLGDIVKDASSGTEFTTEKQLGQGGEGIVFRVEGPGGKAALKWYFQKVSTQDKFKAISDLVSMGRPKAAGGKRFVWPQAIVTKNGMSNFGYIMELLDTDRFITMDDVWNGKKPGPSYFTLCKISYQLANSYRALHLSGCCYRDVSHRNMLFNPKTGEVKIVDNDNVGIDKASKALIVGTPPYLAPEVILNPQDVYPSIDTDLHSLAVLIYHFWLGDHPMHGELENRVHIMDLDAMRFLYGKSPIFVFNPKDDRNRLPDDSDYDMVRARWNSLPRVLKDAFTKAFTDGLRHPSRRVTETEWQNAFLGLGDCAFSCRYCKAVVLWEPDDESGSCCWNCGKAVGTPPHFKISSGHGYRHLVVRNGANIYTRHVKITTSDDDAFTQIGQVVRNPEVKGSVLIANVSKSVWSVEYPKEGVKREIKPNSGLPVRKNMKINIGSAKLEVVL